MGAGNGSGRESRHHFEPFAYLFCCVSYFRIAAHFYCAQKVYASSNVKLLKNLLLAKVRTNGREIQGMSLKMYFRLRFRTPNFDCSKRLNEKSLFKIKGLTHDRL